jgi:nucleoside-diphosphate-sugar epimerase
MNVLITGATGYIGYNFSKFLSSRGFVLHLLIRHSSDLRDLRSLKNVYIHFYNGNYDSIENIFSKNKIEFVFHLATVSYQRAYDEQMMLELNNVCIKLTNYLLRAVIAQQYLVGYVNVGTIWQSKPDFENLYTLFKMYQDEMRKFYSFKYEVKTLSLLLTDSYGPNDWRPKLLNSLLNSIKNNETFHLNNPNNSLGLIFIDDICEALYHSIEILLNQENFYEVYRLESIETVKLIDLIGLIQDKLGFKFDVSYGEEENSKSDYGYEVIDILPGWKPKIYLSMGLDYVLGLKEQK